VLLGPGAGLGQPVGVGAGLDSNLDSGALVLFCAEEHADTPIVSAGVLSKLIDITQRQKTAAVSADRQTLSKLIYKAM
jgi:hypothetical protein